MSFEEGWANFRELEARGAATTSFFKLRWAAPLSGDLERAAAVYKESLLLGREVGISQSFPNDLEGLAAISSVQSDASRGL
jgi:hypothetical protein